MAAGRFRADRFYRLNVFPILVPPAGAETRPAAVDGLFLQRIAKNVGKKLTRISEVSFQQMQAYHWPGNIREVGALTGAGGPHGDGPGALAD